MKYLRIVAAVAFLSFVFLVPTASAADQWVQVKSKNFFLIGNASERDIRKVATRLEQFRSTFAALFTNLKLTAAIPTRVVVFKSDSAYTPFKPIRADGKIDKFIAGFFQSGEDVNYITLSTEGNDKDTFGTIFHEYVHFIVNTAFGKAEVPPWFNEGLAEYYQTFEIQDDQKVKLGLPQSGHLALLQQSQMMPLSDLFRVTGYQLLQTGDHSRSIFYAESWALIHYLIQTGKSDAMSKFLNLSMSGTPSEKAFDQAFGTTYAATEAALRKYIGQNTYHYQLVTMKNKLVFDADMQVSMLGEADRNAYLGDLLYHNNRADDAEPYLTEALKLDPAHSGANTTFGMVRQRQRKFDEAKKYLESAIAGDPKNHLAYYYYAYLLSREGQDEFGYTQALPEATAAKIRLALKKAMQIAPTFVESYELLAFVDLINNVELDDGVAALRTALTIQPGNQKLSLRLGELLARQSKFADASAIADKIVATTDDPQIKSRGENLKSMIGQMQKYAEFKTEREKTSTEGPPRLSRRQVVERPLTEEEMKKASAEAAIRSANQSMQAPADGETRVIGHIQKIDCKVRPIAYSVQTPTETFTLTSVDFNSLTLNAFIEGMTNIDFGCDANVAKTNAVLTYKAVAKGASRGQLVAIEFVPDDFRFMTGDELTQPPFRVVPAETSEPANTGVDDTPKTPTPQEIAAQKRDAMYTAIRAALNTAGEGQKREFGYLEGIFCSDKSVFYNFRIGSRPVKLLFPGTKTAPAIHLFTPDLDGTVFNCQTRPIEFPVVFVYKPIANTKLHTEGEIISLDFVPKLFTVEP